MSSSDSNSPFIAVGSPARVHASLAAVLVTLVVCAVLAGCGFQLRGQSSYDFRSVYVSSPAYPVFAVELRRALSGAGSATVSDTPAGAEVIVDVLQIADDKQVLSLSIGGRVQEYALIKVVAFRVRDAEGRDWLARDEIQIRRSFTYDDSERLAREIQEQRLQKEMQADAVRQIVRRLQSARPPA